MSKGVVRQSQAHPKITFGTMRKFLMESVKKFTLISIMNHLLRLYHYATEVELAKDDVIFQVSRHTRGYLWQISKSVP